MKDFWVKISDKRVPYGRTILKKWSKNKSCPKLVSKIGSRIFFNLAEWDRLTKIKVKENIEKQKEIEKDDRIKKENDKIRESLSYQQ